MVCCEHIIHQKWHIVAPAKMVVYAEIFSEMTLLFVRVKSAPFARFNLLIDKKYALPG